MNILDSDADKTRCCGPEGTGHTRAGKRWCLGRFCAAWRWIERPNAQKPPGMSFGYCGLAGKPDASH